jgi:hypothetical protein
MFTLKLLDLAEIKEWDAEILRKIRSSPILWEPFKVNAPSRLAVGYLETNCRRRTQICKWLDPSPLDSTFKGVDLLILRKVMEELVIFLTYQLYQQHSLILSFLQKGIIIFEQIIQYCTQ